jgi:hypothetical protein
MTSNSIYVNCEYEKSTRKHRQPKKSPLSLRLLHSFLLAISPSKCFSVIVFGPFECKTNFFFYVFLAKIKERMERDEIKI